MASVQRLCSIPVGDVYPVEEGLAVVLDTDTCFHHTAQARASSSEPGRGVEIPCVPPQCSVEYSDEQGRAEWRVVEGKTGRVIQVVAEDDIRWSVSCKFHIFKNEREALEYERPTVRLTPEGADTDYEGGSAGPGENTCRLGNTRLSSLQTRI